MPYFLQKIKVRIIKTKIILSSAASLVGALRVEIINNCFYCQLQSVCIFQCEVSGHIFHARKQIYKQYFSCSSLNFMYFNYNSVLTCLHTFKTLSKLKARKYLRFPFNSLTTEKQTTKSSSANLKKM